MFLVRKCCLLLPLLFVGLALTTSGCTSVRITDPARTATEQFLLSTAATSAVEQLSVNALRGRQSYVEDSYFAASERQFVLAELRAHLITNGVAITNDREKSEVIIEVRSGGVGIDRYSFLLGIPPVLAPESVTGVGGSNSSEPLVTPEIALIKNVKQYGFASVAFIAYWSDTGELISSSGPFVGKSYRQDWWFFGMGPRTIGNIPPADLTLPQDEKDIKEAEEERRKIEERKEREEKLERQHPRPARGVSRRKK